MNLDAGVGDNPARKRVATACEACRATKIRCQPSDQPGVCKKCLESKRECISRTTPRPRRPRKHASPQDQRLHQAQAAPPGPSSTFSIDFSVSTGSEVDDNFETLRDTHHVVIDRLFPEDDEEMSPFPDSVSSFQTPKSSSAQSHSIHDFHTKPSFNVASAESLLTSFRSMLTYFPFITLPEDIPIRQMAAAKPFVLLSILSSTSGSKTLQGHTLYDEEFRKVLGLKFVAGGERSLELLQGLLIYCAWYPFHLRPKNKQAFQYMRMAADMVHDLELDQEQPDLNMWSDTPNLTDEQLDRIRVYVGYFYVVSSFLATWKRSKGIDIPYTSWTARCCEMLEKHGKTQGDLVLAAQTRVSRILCQATKTLNGKYDQVDEDRCIMVAGFKFELAQIESSLAFPLNMSVSLKIQILFIKVFLDSGTLLRFPRPPPSESYKLEPSPLANAKLHDCVYSTAAFYQELMSLEDAAFSCFTIVDWSRPILATILGIRLSFRIPECPDWDSEWARSQLKLDDFLARMSQQKSDLTPASKKVDILSASRTVMGVVREKYQKRLAAVERQSKSPARITCPMLDGSVEPYFPVWDAALKPPLMMEALGEGPDGQPVFQDLWTAMTMGWTHDEL
ncbi:hypothetical protein J3458_009253 [Metarhizium acridum]|uniref:uncharacterized protein n=2 Tax=Metarhizium acridum TaxID=92637 RepID=UPI001C6CCA83|nr:hypothetical protein J3458_009253 [Metarhizium acridum]